MTLRKEVKHVKIMNLHLKYTNKKLKDQVKDLQEQLELIHEELEKKGLKMTVVEEPTTQLIINEEETPQDSQVELVYVLSWFMLKGQCHAVQLEGTFLKQAKNIEFTQFSTVSQRFLGLKPGKHYKTTCSCLFAYKKIGRAHV